MLLDARSIGNHQSFEEMFSYSMFRSCRHIERMKIAHREQLKTLLRISDGGLQFIKKILLVRWRGFNAFDLFVRSQRMNCS